MFEDEDIKVTKEKTSSHNAEYKGEQLSVADGNGDKMFGFGRLSSYQLLHDSLGYNEIASGGKEDKDPLVVKLRMQVEKSRAQIESEFKKFLSPEAGRYLQQKARAYILRGLTYSNEARQNAARLFSKDSKDKFVPSRSAQGMKNFLSLVNSDSNGEDDNFGMHARTNIALEIEGRIKEGTPLPAAIWSPLIMGNKRAIEDLSQVLKNEYVPVLTEQFLTHLPVFLEERYGLSVEAVQQMAPRISVVGINAVDGLMATLESMDGSYSEVSNSIYISADIISQQTEGSLEHTLDHEYFHLLSGRTIRKETAQYWGEGSEPSSYFSAVRVGLGFRDTEAKSDRFGWLDEAITEQLTMEFLTMQGKSVAQPTYESEMNILKYLCSHGRTPVPFRSFVRAYFENYEPVDDAAQETSIPEWRALRRQLNESFNSKFLVALDDLIREEGAEAALAQLESGEFTATNGLREA